MKRKRAGTRKQCKSPQPPENINMLHSPVDSNVGCSESVNPAQPSTSLKTPSFGQLMLSEEDDIINLSSSEELVPSPPPIGSAMRSGENKPSLGSQPIHLPAFMDTKDIRENLLSQSLLESVLRCMSPLDVFSRERVTSQPSHSQAGEEKEAHVRSTLQEESMVGSSKSLAWSNNHGPKYHVGPINAMPQSLSDNCGPTKVSQGQSKVQLSSSRPQRSGRQVGTSDKRADVRLLKDNGHGRPDDQYEYIEVMNCQIPVAVKASGQPSQSSEEKILRKPDGKAPSQAKLYVKTHTDGDVRLIMENGHGRPGDQYEYIEVLNCMIPVVVKESGQPSQPSEEKRLRKPDGKAPSQEKLCKDS